MDKMVKAIHIRSNGNGSSSSTAHHHHNHHHHRPKYETGGNIPTSTSDIENQNHNSHQQSVNTGTSSQSQNLDSSSNSYYNSRHQHHHVHRHGPSTSRHHHHHSHHHSSSNSHHRHQQYHFPSAPGQYHHRGSFPPSQQQSLRHFSSSSTSMHRSRSANHSADPSGGHGPGGSENSHKDASSSIRPLSRQQPPPPHQHFSHTSAPSPPNHGPLPNPPHGPVYNHGHAPSSHHQPHPIPSHHQRSQQQSLHDDGNGGNYTNDTPSSFSYVRSSSSRPMPLQPVVQNTNIPSLKGENSKDDVVIAKPDRPTQGKLSAKPEPMTSNVKPSPSNEIPEVPKAPGSAQKQPRPNPILMKSPVTLCFERMLGAAKYLAHNPTPEVVKERLTKKRKDDEREDEMQAAETPTPLYQELEVRHMEMWKRNGHLVPVPPVPPVVPTEEEAPPKRTKLVRSLPVKASNHDEGNPFMELEMDEELLQKVILQMALISESKETKRVVSEPVSSIIGEGFYWRDYPVLEEILFDNMKNYYNMSSQNRQSRHQQEFNNRLVASIRHAALENGFTFDPSFNDKRLRDRIRCFYKTHLQNAKKRLATLQKHPNSPIHQSHLRIYIRCAKENMSVEDSEAMESGSIVAPSVVLRKRKNEEGEH